MSEYVRERATPLFDDRTFRVSTSLCRFIFESPKVNDALLFMTILSTDLKALKRRGYNGASATTFYLRRVADLFAICQLVDRILRQQKAEREAAEKAKAEARASLISKPPEITVQDTSSKIPTMQTKIPPPPPGPLTTAPPPTPPPATTESIGLEQTSKRSRPASAFNELGRLLRSNRSEASSSHPTPPPKTEDALPPSNPVPSKRDVSPSPNPNVPEGASLSAKPESLRPIVRSQPRQPTSTITPLSNICMSLEPDTLSVFFYLVFNSIANNIDMAIKACTPEKNNLLRNREEMQMVKESLDEGYCDVTGRMGDLDLIGMCSTSGMIFFSPYNVESAGSMGGIKVFAGPGEILPDLNPETLSLNTPIVELPERQTLIQRKHDVLARFLHILNPLVEVYRIPRTSLHVFADSEGQLVAFNRSGSLFMNLRYFEAWRTS